MRLAALGILLGCLAANWTQAEDLSPRFLVIVVDGLRPDYITPDVMPTLHQLGEQGVYFANHHAIVPTVTRVNAASFSTGSYPETHGLMGNSIYFPSVDPDRALNTSDYENLERIREAEGKLLTATTIGEVLDAAGKQYLVISSGSTGSAYLLNPELNGAGIINVDIVLPESLRDHVESKIGPAPGEDIPATARVAWTVDAYVELALGEIHPDVTFLWMTDPDHTAHAKGMGAPETVASLRGVDGQIARILKAHTDAGLTDRMNVLVTSDHGFSTHIGGFNLALFLQQNGFASGVHVADGAIYVDGHDPARIEEIVTMLRAQPTVGPIFTKAGGGTPWSGSVAGTVSFDAVRWRHARAADIFVFPDWNDDANDLGIAGSTFTGGVAGHGSTSAWDIHNTLIASGPSFRLGARSNAPSSNADITPTILHLLGLQPPDTMTGRPLLEAILGSTDVPNPTTSTEFHAETFERSADGTGRAHLVTWTVVNGFRYVDSVVTKSVVF